MIAAARSKAVKTFMQSARATSSLRAQYVAGQTAAAAAERAQRLLDTAGLRSSAFYMGEYVVDADLVAETVHQKLAAVAALRARELDVHISIDPTQIGHLIHPASVAGHARTIARAIASAPEPAGSVHCLMLDMEDASLNDPTIALHDTLQAQGLPVALTLQAYLRRTAGDLAVQITRGSRVRIVKGAFAAGAALAYQEQADIKANFRRLIEMMFSAPAKENGFYPSVATHDDRLHAFTIDMARRYGWRAGEYEFELLLGVREDVARALAARGERVRLYLPFGVDWWPHAVRRIGENPRNALLLARSLLR